MFKTIFSISVAVVGVIEWLKNVLPSKITKNKVALTVFSGAISALTGAAYVFFGQKLGISKIDPTNWQNYVIVICGTIGCVQICYQALLKTFNAIIVKLQTEITNDVLSSDEISEGEETYEITELGKKALAEYESKQ